MTEAEVKTLVLANLDDQKVQLLNIVRTPRAEVRRPTTVGDEWTVYLMELYEPGDSEAVNAMFFLIIDDATGEITFPRGATWPDGNHVLEPE